MSVQRATILGLAIAVLGLCLVSRPARAHLPEVFGREYIRAETDSANSPPSSPASKLPGEDPPVAGSADPFAFDRQVRDREGSGGPYAAGLTEPLSSLGLYYRKKGDYEKARAAYRRALHVARINDGLSSTRQIPILRELMIIYRTTGDYDALEGIYKYYTRVRGIGKVPHDQQGFDDCMEVLQWQREAYATRMDGQQDSHLLEAFLVNKQLLESIAADADVRLDWHSELVLSQMRNLYLLLGAEEAQLVSTGISPGQGGPDEAVQREIARIQKTAFYRGKNLLRDLIARSQSLPLKDLAALHLELGDWYQWNDQLGKASTEYARVSALLRSAGKEQLLARWLDQPMELPDENNLWHRAQAGEEKGRVVVASYRVSARGQARDIEISEMDREHSGSSRRIKRMLLNTHFRPRFSQGKAEGSGEVTRRYRLID